MRIEYRRSRYGFDRFNSHILEYLWKSTEAMFASRFNLLVVCLLLPAVIECCQSRADESKHSNVFTYLIKLAELSCVELGKGQSLQECMTPCITQKSVARTTSGLINHVKQCHETSESNDFNKPMRSGIKPTAHIT